MNVDGILSLTWFALCSYRFAQCCRTGVNQIRGQQGISVPESVKSLFWSAIVFYYVLYLAGIVASIWLFLNGSTWARAVVCLVAGVELFTSILVIIKAKLPIIKNCLVPVISVISLVLLFSDVVQRLVEMIR